MCDRRNVLNADFPGIMSIEDAKSQLQREREAYVQAHLTDPRSKKLRRRIQNRINKYVSRWKTSFYLETTEDYYILACEIQDMREGRTKRREGRPRRPDDRSKRRTSKRLADKHRKPEDVAASEEDNLFDSTIALDFAQFDNVPPSEEEVNISTAATTSRSAVTSSGDEFLHSISNEVDRTPDTSSNSFFDLYNSQTLSQYSHLPSLADESWYYSDDMNDPASISGMLHSETNLAGDRWVRSQHDLCDGNPMDVEWQSDLASFCASHALSGNGDGWSGTNTFEPESNRSAAATNGLAMTPRGSLDLHDAIMSMSSNVDGCTQTQSSEVPLPRDRVNGTQQPREFDQTQLYIVAAELKSQLLERRKNAVPKGPVSTSRPPLGKPQDLAPLIEQCLSALRRRRPTPHTSKDKTNGLSLEDRRTILQYRTEVRLQMTIEYLWNAVRVESCRVPSCVS
jgi:hypothetical protein